jgi:hypothetical protein
MIFGHFEPYQDITKDCKETIIFSDKAIINPAKILKP